MRLIVDTSVLIDHLRGGSTWKDVLDKLPADTELFVATIIFYELFSGKSTNDPAIISKIHKLLSNFERIDLNEDIARQAGVLFRDTKKTLQVPDYIIVASALGINATVMTLNKKHFQQIPNLSIYPI